MRQAVIWGLVAAGLLAAFQRPFRELNGIEYSAGSIPIPPDFKQNTEWVFARLMFPPGPLNGYAGRDLDWQGTVAAARAAGRESGGGSG